jgi:cell wall-associated NlpC family hydrolase
MSKVMARRRMLLGGSAGALAIAGASAIAIAGCGAAAPASPAARAPGSSATLVRAVAPRASRRDHAEAASPDSEAGQSFPLPDGMRGTRSAPQPGDVDVDAASPADASVSPGAPSDAEVLAELREMQRVVRRARRAAAPLAVAGAGQVEIPAGLPEAVARVIAGANAIARFPYVYGGGHGSFVDSAYDCSGSVSYALASAGLLDGPLTSGELASWGERGPGRWITIYANAGHTFLYVNGLRFDTSGRSGRFGTRWQTAPRSLAGFRVRHPPGL